MFANTGNTGTGPILPNNWENGTCPCIPEASSFGGKADFRPERYATTIGSAAKEFGETRL